MTSKEVKVKVISFKPMYHGLSCGRANFKILEGKNKGKKTGEMPVYSFFKKGEVTTLYENES